MTFEPKRLLDDGNSPGNVLDLLRALPPPAPPSALKEAELAQRLAVLASPVAAGSGLAASGWLKAALLSGAVALVGTGLYFGLSGPKSAHNVPASRANATSSLAAPPTGSALSATAPEPEPAAPEADEHAAPSPAAPRTKPLVRDTLADEEALLEQARRLSTSAPNEALRLLQLHERRFPKGQLTAERMFLKVDVLRRLGDSTGAQTQASALKRRYPDSMYSTRVGSGGKASQ